MIQFKRGSTASWKKLKKPLAAGQPGYDKNKHKIKIGDGVSLWEKLPYASISEEEVLDSEKNAKERLKADPESLAIITYGTDGPDSKTVGKLYLQHYDSEPEVDYVVAIGVDDIWHYRKWHSGFAECWGTVELTTAIQSTFEDKVLYHSDIDIERIKYPFVFRDIPNESASLRSLGNVTWLASTAPNLESKTGKYLLISPYKSISARYGIALYVSGYLA